MPERRASISRTTSETDIRISLDLDGSGVTDISTKVPFFDHMLNAFGRHGLFDLTVIPNMNRVRLFRRFRVVYTGNIYDIPQIRLFRGGRIEVQADRPVRLEIDGEILGYSDFEFQIIERAVRVVVSEKFIRGRA